MIRLSRSHGRDHAWTIAATALAVLVAASLAGASAVEGPLLRTDVVYGHAGEVDLKLDLALPPSGDGPFPILVFIHGGAWAGGSKVIYDQAIVACAGAGYVAATIEYRFAPHFHFPAQIEDAKCAVRYLRAHAQELHGDPARVGAIGDSAGGHLALLLGLMDAKDGLEGSGGWADQPSKVQLVVDYYGPSDLRSIATDNPALVDLLTNFLGTADWQAPIVAQASPITYIDRNDAPVLILHGAKDTLVPLSQAQRLQQALKQAGVESRLEILPDAGHGFGGADADHALQLTKDFIERHFKPH